nr:MAG TPA: hypothetical protein [Caudoviricetes sp.]
MLLMWIPPPNCENSYILILEESLIAFGYGYRYYHRF